MTFASTPVRRSTYSLLFLLALAPLMGGCDLVERPAIDPLGAVRSFGAPYTITNRLASDFLPGASGSTPALTADGTLLASLVYSGGCAPHTFSLNFTLEADRAIIWFVHDDGGDTCEGSLEEFLVERLGPRILDQPMIVLADPDGSELVLHTATSL